MECSPINVSDLAAILGGYGSLHPPCIIGSEGSGTVIKAGNHPYAQSLVGKRVSCLAGVQGFGTYAEYMVSTQHHVFPLKDAVTFEQAASLIVNPFTVALFVQKIKESNNTSVIFNASASALGKMLIRWCKILNIKTISLVRRQEQVDQVTEIGTDYVFNTSEAN